MRRRPLVFGALPFLLLPLTSAARAEEPPGAWASPRVPGAHSMQFSINENFTLGTFEGASFSLQRQRSERAADRFGLTVNLSVGSNGNDDSRTDTTFSASVSRDIARDHQMIALSAHRIVYASPARRATFCGGLGPFVSYLRDHAHERSVTPATTISGEEGYVNVSDRNEWAVGFDGLVGVDWGFGGNFALLAEYSSQLSFTRGKIENERHQTAPTDILLTSTTTYQSTQLYSSGVRFGISAYY